MAAILTGTTLGGYIIHEELGQGGMATVYRARQLSMDRDVAIKVLPEQFTAQVPSLERFRQEAAIVARLEHRAIVPVHDFGEHEGVPYLVMRYMDGGSVDDLLADGPLAPERALAILDQIGPALDYAHREGVLHRDLKPSNILLDANGDAFLTDFGIARILRSTNKPLTTSGVVGTPSYMSPEQAQGHELDGRSDVYALGVVVFELLTGRRPFEGETPYSVAVKHVTEAPPSPCGINPRLPQTVEAVLFRALAKDRAQRYQTAAELAAALTQVFRAAPAIPVAELMEQTAPSLGEALRASPASRAEAGQEYYYPAAPFARGTPPELQFIPAYVPPAPSYPRLARARRQPQGILAGGTWWLAIGLLAAGLLLALGLSAAYYVLNDTRGDVAALDYGATAIFKLTATKEAILSDELPEAAGLPGLAPTVPPTNTPRPE